MATPKDFELIRNDPSYAGQEARNDAIGAREEDLSDEVTKIANHYDNQAKLA